MPWIVAGPTCRPGGARDSGLRTEFGQAGFRSAFLGVSQRCRHGACSCSHTERRLLLRQEVHRAKLDQHRTGVGCHHERGSHRGARADQRRGAGARGLKPGPQAALPIAASLPDRASGVPRGTGPCRRRHRHRGHADGRLAGAARPAVAAKVDEARARELRMDALLRRCGGRGTQVCAPGAAFHPRALLPALLFQNSHADVNHMATKNAVATNASPDPPTRAMTPTRT